MASENTLRYNVRLLSRYNHKIAYLLGLDVLKNNINKQDQLDQYFSQKLGMLDD